MELTERKKRILKIVVENYIETAEPLGSKAIAERMPTSVSSATIRNELADLTDMGYLEQPHTSAGRIPSSSGYRLYVNELMERRTLSDEETASINKALTGPMAQVDQVVAKSGQMVSQFMNYPAFAMTDNKSVVKVKRFELITVDEYSFIAVVMLSDNRVKSQLIHLDLKIVPDKLPDMAHLLNTHFIHIDVEDMNQHLINLADQVSGEWFLLLNKVVEYTCELLQDSNQKQMFTSGASQLFNFPEFQNINKAHEIMHFMVDNHDGIPVSATDSPMQILIGPENVNSALKDSSVVIASYDIGDNMRGLVGVVGPTRMDYATVAARLSYFAESLTKMFGKAKLPAKEENQKNE